MCSIIDEGHIERLKYLSILSEKLRGTVIVFYETEVVLKSQSFRSSISSTDANKIKDLFDRFGNEDPIFLLLDSGGGDPIAGIEIAKTIRKFNVTTIIPNRAKSIAALIGLSGNRLWCFESSKIGTIDPYCIINPYNVYNDDKIPIFLHDLSKTIQGEEKRKVTELLQSLDAAFLECTNRICTTLYQQKRLMKFLLKKEGSVQDHMDSIDIGNITKFKVNMQMIPPEISHLVLEIHRMYARPNFPKSETSTIEYSTSELASGDNMREKEDLLQRVFLTLRDSDVDIAEKYLEEIRIALPLIDEELDLIESEDDIM